ncbi:MAG: mandelate racemase/muconate lactonizing enzyme family protein, partial [Planctomycetes bacterium]|nr:mandelate racemase/muconate lactonizing enzyme family protein [Planctomycetota bacterium]
HLVSDVPNALFLERLILFQDLPTNVFVNAPQVVNGYMEVPNLPGLGLTLNMDFINEHDEKSC